MTKKESIEGVIRVNKDLIKLFKQNIKLLEENMDSIKNEQSAYDWEIYDQNWYVFRNMVINKYNIKRNFAGFFS